MKQGKKENKALASLVNLVDVSGLLSLPELMKHCISEECLILFNANGRLLQKLELQPL